MHFFQLKGFPWNLYWFLANQIVLKTLMIAERITILHWGDHDLSQRVHMSFKDWKWRLQSTIDASQHQSLKAKLHSKKRWKVVSVVTEQREHIDGRLHPLSMSFSSVGTLSCINLQASRDLNGGISLHQIVEAQCFFGTGCFLKEYTSFKVSFPLETCFQISWSSVSSTHN